MKGPYVYAYLTMLWYRPVEDGGVELGGVDINEIQFVFVYLWLSAFGWVEQCSDRGFLSK